MNLQPKIIKTDEVLEMTRRPTGKKRHLRIPKLEVIVKGRRYYVA